jgi:uncharacterized protein
MMSNDKTFLGSGWAFPPRFINQTTHMVKAEADIQESLYILLATAPGERVMQPTYGCALKLYVFDNIDESAVAVMKDTISKAILFFEPRVVVETIAVTDLDPLEGKISINVYYRVRATNNRYNLVYPFYFNEATNIAH